MALPPAFTLLGVADVLQTYAPQADGTVLIDWPLTPQGDLTSVLGPALLRQRVLRFFYAPYGSDPWHPTYGSRLWGQLQQPVLASNAAYASLVQADQAAFLAIQATEFSEGTLAPDVLVAQFTQTQVTLLDQILQVSMVIVPEQGASQTLPLVFPAH